MANDAQPYGIGSQVWPGLAKLMEEMGELQQVLGKIMACEGPSAKYWDGSSLIPHLQEEVADVQAALMFFRDQNGLDIDLIADRREEKLQKFNYWHNQHAIVGTDGKPPRWLEGWQMAIDFLEKWADDGVAADIAEEMEKKIEELRAGKF